MTADTHPRHRPRAPYPVPADREGEQACAGVDTDLFFPPDGWQRAAVERARTICRSCPFLAACTAYAMDRPALHGMWGGLTQAERAALRRRAS